MLFRQQGAAARRSRCATGSPSRCARRRPSTKRAANFSSTSKRCGSPALGALYERFARLKAKLEAAGWFETARKRALPAFPRAVGVVTSRHAAALARRADHARAALCRRCRVILYPARCRVSARRARLPRRSRTANARAEVDVLIVCRGGGSIEDLWAFNEEVVARAVFESVLPIVSGVGHETDFTICDFVADVRAPTPTAAAALVAPDRLRCSRTPLHDRRRWQRAARARARSRACSALDLRVAATRASRGPPRRAARATLRDWRIGCARAAGAAACASASGELAAGPRAVLRELLRRLRRRRRAVPALASAGCAAARRARRARCRDALARARRRACAAESRKACSTAATASSPPPTARSCTMRRRSKRGDASQLTFARGGAEAR